MNPQQTAHGEGAVLLVGGVFGLLLLLGMAVFVNVGTYRVAAAVLVLVFMLIVSAIVFRRLSDADGDPQLLTVLLLALIAKMVFSILRYWMVNRLYGGAGDSNRYDVDGWLFAEQVRSGNLIPFSEYSASSEVGTGFIIRLTGYFYSIVGRSIFAGFFFYSWLAFWGCLLVARGLKRAFPEADYRRYLYLVLFWPSLLFWPSAIGKDSVMVFFLGIATYGACMVFAPRARFLGVIPFAVGVYGMLQIRPHVALMAVLAIVVATTFAFIGGDKVKDAGKRGRAARLAGLVIMVMLALTAATQTTRFFSEEAGQATSTTDALELTVRRTQQGGSEFQPIVVTGPAQIPAATVSVLFRPFPWEVRSVGMAVSALEAAALALLFVLSWRRLWYWPPSAWRRALLLYGAIYSLMFVVAFSSIGNAGILARQRSQMLPMLLLAFAVPKVRWWRGEDSEVESDAPAAATWGKTETPVSR